MKIFLHTWLFVLAVFSQKVYVQKRYFKRRDPALVRSSLEFAVVKGHDTQGRHNTQHPICWRPRIPPASQLKVLLHPSETSQPASVWTSLSHLPYSPPSFSLGLRALLSFSAQCDPVFNAIQCSLHTASFCGGRGLGGGGWNGGRAEITKMKCLSKLDRQLPG